MIPSVMATQPPSILINSRAFSSPSRSSYSTLFTGQLFYRTMWSTSNVNFKNINNNNNTKRICLKMYIACKPQSNLQVNYIIYI